MTKIMTQGTDVYSWTTVVAVVVAAVVVIVAVVATTLMFSVIMEMCSGKVVSVSNAILSQDCRRNWFFYVVAT